MLDVLTLLLSAGAVAGPAAFDGTARAAVSCPAIALEKPLDAARPQGSLVLGCQWNRSCILLFGEVHGTKEVPAYIGQLIDAEAGKHPIVLALERTDDEAAAMDNFMAPGGTDADKAALTPIRGWAGPFTDGRSSRAVLDLIDHVRKLRQGGAEIRVALSETTPKNLPVLKDFSSAQCCAEHGCPG